MAVRVTQTGVEVARDGDAAARVTQSGIEVARQGDGAARVTQVGIEVLMPNLSQVQAKCFIVG